jgi:hypothetical protein
MRHMCKRMGHGINMIYRFIGEILYSFFVDVVILYWKIYYMLSLLNFVLECVSSVYHIKLSS